MMSHTENAMRMLAYTKGRDAYWSDFTEKACRYPVGSMEREQWMQGFSDAQREAMAIEGDHSIN